MPSKPPAEEATAYLLFMIRRQPCALAESDRGRIRQQASRWKPALIGCILPASKSQKKELLKR